ncbi:hypothetical protein ILUMI_04312 [Ignelater luminosus]|uniref:Glutathione transferase n=1 Tax=Ignelater luminosus TaxID=2038154 RepID=A0A8K0DD34_IGNLU|nr:hypothetical protein ILUMI_04312 [Ignelater luminosus]
MSLKLYYDLLSQPSRALYIYLQVCKIPFEKCPVALRKGEHLSEEFKKDISRFQKVPVIKDGGFTLAESIAILRYLSREKQFSNEWYPKDSKLQAQVDEYLEWQHNNIRTFGTLYFRTKWIQPLLTGEPPNAKKVATYEKHLAECLSSMEELFLKDKPFIAGDKATAADIWAACEIEQPRITGFDPVAGRPVLSKWLNTVRKTFSPYYEEAHLILNKLVAKANAETK